MTADRDKARKAFSRMRANIAELELCLLRLLRHSQVSQEQILAAREEYMRVYSSYVETRHGLQEKWPMRSQWGRNDPWWDKL